MSIINDALKKTQENLENNQNTQPFSTPPAPPAPADSTSPAVASNETAPMTKNADASFAQDSNHGASTPPQSAETVPDMSIYIPQKEKKVSPEPPPDTPKTQGLAQRAQQKPVDRSPSGNLAKKIFSFLFFLVLLGGIVVAYYYYYAPQRKGSPPPSYQRVTREIKKDIAKAVEAIPLPAVVKEVTAPEKKTVREAPPAPAGVLVLNGIVTMEDRKVALINNKIYEVGDVVDGQEIIRIDIDRVEVRNAEGTKILKVRK